MGAAGGIEAAFTVLTLHHGGFALKTALVPYLRELGQGHEVADLGNEGEASVDYPDYAAKLCEAVGRGEFERGILVCGTGIGMCMVANRYRHIRAALCHDAFTARMSREHNDANVLCLGSRVLGNVQVVLTTSQNFLAAAPAQRTLERGTSGGNGR